MPEIKLSFQHPLNTSVQVGDIAYFANAKADPVVNPIDPTSNLTHDHNQVISEPPHETASQADIIKIGKITEIGPFNGNLGANIMGESYIVCDMDQALFNKYGSNFIVGGCHTTYNFQTATGNIAGFPTLANTNPLDTNYHACSTCTNAQGQSIGQINPLTTYFKDNPSANVIDVVFRHIMDLDPLYGSENVWRITTGGALMSPSDPYYQPGRVNTFISIPGFIINDAGILYYEPQGVAVPPGPAPTITVNTTSNYSYGLAQTTYPNATSIEPQPYTLLTTTDNGLLGTNPATTTNCSSGSFIMFSKDNKVNQPDMLGYYALVEYRNNDFENYSELFNTGVTYFNSSK